jgi:hypothetical protein
MPMRHSARRTIARRATARSKRGRVKVGSESMNEVVLISTEVNYGRRIIRGRYGCVVIGDPCTAGSAQNVIFRRGNPVETW